jgi:hypothetical protein
MAQTLTARVWREYPQRYRLEAKKDKDTGKVYFPPRVVVPGNLQPEFEDTALSGTGKVVTYTIIQVPPTPMSDLAPYALVIVDTPEGVRLMAQMSDCDPDEVTIGMEVEFEFRRIYEDNEASVIYYGYKAVPK